MALSLVDQQKEIYEQLRKDDVKTIVLAGELGAGTWMARKLSDLAISEHLYDITLWVFLNRKCDNKALLKSIARQVSLLPTAEDDNGEEEENLEILKKKIIGTLEGKTYLLILDDEGSKVSGEEIIKELEGLLPLNWHNSHKVLITQVSNNSSRVSEETRMVFPVMVLSSTERREIIYEQLRHGNVRTIVLVGEPGVGTWTARQLSDRAINEHLYDVVIWVFLNRKNGSRTLLKSIARQLSLLSAADEWEEEDDYTGTKEEEERDEENLKRKISEELDGKWFLLILDDEEEKTNEVAVSNEGGSTMKEEVMLALNTLLGLKHRGLYKVLISTVQDSSVHFTKGSRRVFNVMTMGSVDRRELIFDQLKHGNARRIVLSGTAGVGKTWMAKELSDRAIREHLCDISLWVFLNKKYDHTSLHESIARQLSLLPAAEDWEDENDNKEAKEEVEKEKEERERGENLEEKISVALKGKTFLLILDGEETKTNEEEIMSKLSNLLHRSRQGSYKILITTVDDLKHATQESRRVFVVQPLSLEESLSSLREIAGSVLDQFPGVKVLAEAFVEKSRRLPAEIIVIAKALCYYGQDDSRVRELEGILAKASDDENYNVMRLLCSGYVMLPESVLIDCCWRANHFFRDHGGVHFNELIAYWILEGYIGHGDSFEKAYEKGHQVLMELIGCRMLQILGAGYVIMERTLMYLDDCHRCGFGGTANLGLANVFQDGEWEGLGIIAQEDGMMRTLCSGKRGPRLSTLLLDGKVLGSKNPNELFQSKVDLQILALFNPTFQSLELPWPEMKNLMVLVLRSCDLLKKIDHKIELTNLTVLEISGPSSLKTIPNNLFELTQNLRSVNLSSLQIDSLPSSLYDLTGLVWLILRGCSRLEMLQSIKNFVKLMVLDLSGATSLRKIFDISFSHNPELQTINLSQTKITILPFVPGLGKLTHLLLSGCKHLWRLRSIDPLSSLQVLDLSSTEDLKYFHDESFKQTRLKILDLKGCSKLQKLPSIEAQKGLEILDLSGTSSLLEFPDNYFENLIHLQVLNLSKTELKGLSSLSNLCNLQHLLLCYCSCLAMLPDLSSLRKLEVLDLSGCGALTDLQISNLHSLRHLLLSGCLCLNELRDLNSLQKLEVLDLSGCSALTKMEISFEQVSQLQRLDLSETKIEYVPSLSNLGNLRQLSLKKCTELKVFPSLGSLLKLEDLNLCGVSLNESQADFLVNMIHLRTLDLSETSLKKLPSISNLINLEYLSLSKCPHMEMVSLEALTKLEVLDLSGTPVRCLPSLENFSSLRQLLLGNCLKLEKFLHLEMLDLLGATATELPYGISKLTHLEHLELPNMKNRNMECPQEEMNQSQWSITALPAKALTSSDRPLFSISSTEFLQLLKNNPSLGGMSTQFHFCVLPIKIGGDGYFSKNEIFRDTYLQTSQFAHFREKRSLRICGFKSFPEGLGDVLSHAECLFLVENKFQRWLSDLGASNVKTLKGCWIERCNEMENVFYEEESEDNAILGKTLNVLGISNAIKLKSLYNRDLPCESFQSLNSLYIDSCPMLATVLPSSQLLENLKCLQIKFCDKLETLFMQTSSEHQLPNLESLLLWELPELKHVGCALPSLKKVKLSECPKLQDSEEIIKLAENLQSQDF
ncbi:hypothetical protein RJ639_016760 [Escallonia herrerae]|uniref:Uncharacterized protein n=1 Tax=Escallonia herrerae TaxID=1293975 RepID=A0AA88VDK0_9ASTE|nr:hypothetical protein RJ639_016760 [Escallonia herrerae]